MQCSCFHIVLPNGIGGFDANAYEIMYGSNYTQTYLITKRSPSIRLNCFFCFLSSSVERKTTLLSHWFFFPHFCALNMLATWLRLNTAHTHTHTRLFLFLSTFRINSRIFSFLSSVFRIVDMRIFSTFSKWCSIVVQSIVSAAFYWLFFPSSFFFFALFLHVQ